MILLRSDLAQSLQAVTDHLHAARDDYLRRFKISLAVSVADQLPKSHSFECRPRHGSLPLLSEVCRLGRPGCVGLAREMCRVCWGRTACVVVLGICLGGDAIMGDFDRLRDASRDRLLERPRTRAVMALKKFCSVGELPRDVGDVGEKDGDI